MPMNFVNSSMMDEQIQRMGQADLDELARIKRDIRFETNNRAAHKLQGLGNQGILGGASARDFRFNQDVRGAWRLIYDDENNDTVTLLGILDYHGGGAQADLYLLGRTIDPS